jgi:hypothetical protein
MLEQVYSPTYYYRTLRAGYFTRIIILEQFYSPPSKTIPLSMQHTMWCTSSFLVHQDGVPAAIIVCAAIYICSFQWVPISTLGGPQSIRRYRRLSPTSRYHTALGLLQPWLKGSKDSNTVVGEKGPCWMVYMVTGHHKALALS